MRRTIGAAVFVSLLCLSMGCSSSRAEDKKDEPHWIPNDMSMHTDPYDVAREVEEDTAAKSPRAAARDAAGTAPVAPAFSSDEKDAYLQGRVETIYDLNQRLSTQDLQARVVGGEVYLSGTVDSDIERDLAVDLARSVDGVKGVRSMLAIRNQPPATGAPAIVDDRTMNERMNDANITASVRQALVDDVRTRGSAIEVASFRGQVSLQGLVASEEVSLAAGAIAASIPGVGGVTNGIAVRGR